jgi:N-methylhydantoinase B
MDHGRVGPNGALGGRPGGVNRVRIERADGSTYIPPHLSKDQDIELAPGDVVAVSTPGGGGFGDPREREPALIARDLARGYYTEEEALEQFGAAAS